MAGGPLVGAAHQLGPQRAVGYPLELHVYADFLPHLGDDLANLQLQRCATQRGRQDYAEAVGIASLGQQLFGSLRIVPWPVPASQVVLEAGVTP